MSDGADEGQGAPGSGTGGLANLLLNSYQERLIQSRLQEEQEREDGAQEEEEDEEDDGELFSKEKHLFPPHQSRKVLLSPLRHPAEGMGAHG